MNNYIKKQTDIQVQEAVTNITLVDDYITNCVSTINSMMGIEPVESKEETCLAEEKK